jgi:hypothetical protein
MFSGLQKVAGITAGMASVTLGQQIVKFGVLAIGSAGIALSRGTQTTLIKNVAEALLMGNKSGFAQSIKAYQKEGFSQKEAVGLAAIDWFWTDPIETGGKMGAMAGLSVLPTAARTAYGTYTAGYGAYNAGAGGQTYSAGGPLALTAGTAQQANSAGFTASPASTALTPVYTGSAAGLQHLPATSSEAAALALSAAGAGAYAGRSIPQVNGEYGTTPLAPADFIQLGMSEDGATLAAKLDAYLMLPASATGSKTPQELLIPYTGGLALPKEAAAITAPPKVIKGVGDTAEELQTLSDKTSLDLFNDNVQGKYYGFALNPTLGTAKTMYEASLQSLKDGIAESAPQPAAELMQQADVVENRLGEVYKAAGVMKDLQPPASVPALSLPPEQTATDVGTLFSNYYDSIGADEMPPLAEFGKMYREGGDAWKELSLKKGWKEGLKSGEVGPFTRFEEYKAMVGVGYIDNQIGIRNNVNTYLGQKTKGRFDYKEVFFGRNPDLKGMVVVHHSIEQQVLRRPETAGLFTEEEIQAYENLRGIPNEINSDLHLSRIRKEWNRFYKENRNATREQVIQKRMEIDREYGHLFKPKFD